MWILSNNFKNFFLPLSCPFLAPFLPLLINFLKFLIGLSSFRGVLPGSFLPFIQNIGTNSCFHNKGNQVVLWFSDTQCGQFTAHTVNTFTKLFYIVVCFEKFRNFRITREMGMAYVISADNARQLAWCFEHKTVVEHLYLNFSSFYTIVTMTNRVYHHLLYYKLWIFTVCLEDAVFTKIGVFLDLCFKIFYSFPYLFKNRSFKKNIFDNIHFSPDHFFCTKILDKADSCTREECLRMLAKKQYTSCTDLRHIAFIGHKTFVLLQVLHCRLAIANPLHIGFDCIHIYIFKRSTICCGILIIAFSLVVHKLQSLIESQFF